MQEMGDGEQAEHGSFPNPLSLVLQPPSHLHRRCPRRVKHAVLITPGHHRFHAGLMHASKHRSLSCVRPRCLLIRTC